MNDEPALLAAIRAHPDEDTPRLIYADWLQENGDPERAEFIRLQCDPEPSEEQFDRADELEERYRERWLVGVPQVPRVQWRFRRGFAEHLDAPADVFLEWYDGFACAPWLRSLALSGLNNSLVRAFVSRTWNPRWVELKLVGHSLNRVFVIGYDGTPALTAIANCPQVQQLRRLRLSGLAADAKTNRALAPLREQLGHRLVIH